MTTTDKLDQLLYYFTSRRRVGHTKAMLCGVANTEKITVMVANEVDKRYVWNYAPNAQFVTWEHPNLLGKNDPLVLDNHALTNLIQDVLSIIGRLEKENEGLRKELKEGRSYTLQEINTRTLNM
jgi:hypothetical protein